MIVPRSRLLFWVAALLLPFAALAAIEPDALALSLAFITLFLLLTTLDAFKALSQLDGIGITLPPVLRLTKDREATFQLQITNPTQRARRLRFGFALPPEIRPASPELIVSLPADSEWSRLDWGCTGLKRGNYSLTHAYIETTSPTGFWAVRARLPVNSQLRVYPNLFTERKHLAALFSNRGPLGVHALRQVGQGRDFEKLREYIPGDSYDEIHWKATAKRGHPVTKVFQIERTQEVYVVIDSSRLSARTADPTPPSLPPPGTGPGSTPTGSHPPSVENTILERFITTALILGLAAEQQGDLFGILAFSNKVDSFVRAKNGQAHSNHCRDALYTLQPRAVTPDFDEITTFIRLRLRRRALLIFLTALDDPVLAQSFVSKINLICRQHLVLVNMIKPPGANPLFSDPQVRCLDDLYRQLGGHLRWHDLRELEKILQRRGVRFGLLENEKLSVQLVSQYLGIKQRQLI